MRARPLDKGRSGIDPSGPCDPPARGRRSLARARAYTGRNLGCQPFALQRWEVTAKLGAICRAASLTPPGRVIAHREMGVSLCRASNICDNDFYHLSIEFALQARSAT